VSRYNEAIAQFPAVLLAWLFGFKPGRGVRPTAAAAPT
jgi:LemA protein